jgi:hypothetical protein
MDSSDIALDGGHICLVDSATGMWASVTPNSGHLDVEARLDLARQTLARLGEGGEPAVNVAFPAGECDILRYLCGHCAKSSYHVAGATCIFVGVALP